MSENCSVEFKNIAPSKFIQGDIEKHANQLSRRHRDITGCNVVVNAPHKTGKKGGIYEVHIHVEIPGDVVVVSREPAVNHAHEDLYVAIRDAFGSAEKILASREGKRHDRYTHGPSLKDWS